MKKKYVIQAIFANGILAEEHYDDSEVDAIALAKRLKEDPFFKDSRTRVFTYEGELVYSSIFDKAAS